MKEIRLNLSKKSVRRAIQKLKATEEQMKTLADVVSRKLAEEAVKYARTSLGNSGKDYDASLFESIQCEPIGRGMYRIVSHNPHLWYVELGTGPVGAEDPHPKANESWYREEGWVTAADGKDMEAKYGWTPIHLKNGDTIYYTHGQPSRHFMYDGYEYIQQKEVVDRIVAQAIEEVFNR